MIVEEEVDADVHRRLSQALLLLQEIEWAADGECLFCDGIKPGSPNPSLEPEDHAPDCRLAEVLQRN